MARHLSIGKRKIIPGLGAAVIALLLLASPGKAVKADGNIPIDEEHFPDKNFRAAIAEDWCDRNKDGELTSGEIGEVYGIEVNGRGIKSLEGIQIFRDLRSLDASDNELTEVDLSSNPHLVYLAIRNNKLNSLDLSKMTDLISLVAENNQLKEITLPKSSTLTMISLGENQLSKIDVTKNKELESLYINSNNLKTINLKNNSKIRNLHSNDNKITELDISNLTELEFLNLSDNKLTKIDVTKNTKLEGLYLASNELTSINLSKNKKLSFLDLNFNKLTGLDVSKNKELLSLYCSGNSIKSLSLGANYKLDQLYCTGNPIKSLDVSKNLKLKFLSCGNLDLKELDVSKNTEIVSLVCYGNDIAKLNIKNNKKLVEAIEKGVLSVNSPYDGFSFIEYVYTKGDPDQSDYIYEYLAFDESTQIIDGIPGSISLDKTTSQPVCGGSFTLKATLKDISGKVTWKSSDPKIASVDSKGKVTTKMAGTVTITASVKTKKAACNVVVLYKDVTNPKDFWFTPTNSLTAIGVVKGYDNQTNFKPANECTRAQMRLCGSPEPNSGKCKFKDVKAGDYFYKPVIWAVEKGITTGYNDGTFKPKNVCTRAQTVTFLWRLAGKPNPRSSTCKFSDVKSTDYFFEPVIWASERKIVAGYKNGTFKPQGKCLRRQMVTFLYKFNSWGY